MPSLRRGSGLQVARFARDLPVWQTVYTYFRNWRKDGTWVKIHDRLRDWVRVDCDRQASPSKPSLTVKV